MTAREKLKSIREELKQTFLERADLIDGALAALLSSHHLLIIGPPGTAKSMLADELCRRVEGADYFQWLLTRFTTPEEIFGAVSLKALEQDDYRRVTTRKLPDAHRQHPRRMFRCLLRMFGEGDSPDPRPACRPGLNLYDHGAIERLRDHARLLSRSRRRAARNGKPMLRQQRLALKLMQPGHSSGRIREEMCEL